MSRTTLVDRTSAIDATVTRSCNNSSVTALRALYFLEVVTAASTAATWTVTLQVKTPNGTAVSLSDALTVGAETTGILPFVLATAYKDATDQPSPPKPFPDQILYTETSAGSSLTADVFVVWV